MGEGWQGWPELIGRQVVAPFPFCYAFSDNAHSVLLLPKIGSKTDWDVQKLEGQIVKILDGRRTKSYAEDSLQVPD
jgi:hypothetical protein